MKHGSIVAVCRSDEKGVAKQPVASGRLISGHGLNDDAHAGNRHRQVSLLDIGDIRDMQAKGLTLEPGAFGENLILADIDTAELGLGSRLKLGEAEIEITQIGKVCHDRCAIYYSAGDCIMPRLGLFAEVCADGEVRAGDPVEIVHQVPRDYLQVAVLEDSEGAGQGIVKRIEAEVDVHLAWHGPVPGGKAKEETIRELCGRGLHLLVFASSDTETFSAVVDSGSEVDSSTGLRGRVSKTVVALVDRNDGDPLIDDLVCDLLVELRRDKPLSSSHLPTVSIGLVGAR